MAVHHGKAPAIGIDLGTTCSCVGVYQHGKVQIITNALGNQTTPSYVAFTDSHVLIGEEAKNQAAMSPKNTFFEAKRLIGRRFTDQHVQSDMKHWPFTVVDQGGKPVLQAEYLGETIRTITPEKVSSMILTKMKETAEAYLGQEVNDAVITVPVNFDDDQRNATKEAGVIAGLNVFGVLNEHTAAALAYGLHKRLPVEQHVLVIDIGGVTLNVAVLLIDDGIFEVKSRAVDTHLGGDAFDNRLVHHLIEEFKRVYDKDLRSNPRAVRQLRNAAERAKRTLSTSAEAVIEEEALLEGTNFHTIVTREQFEDLCSDLFTKLLEPIEKAIAGASISKEQLDTVLLVGGSSRIPKIRELLQKALNGKDLKMCIDPDEAVAYGAAVQAALLSGDHPDKVDAIVMIDVAPLSLGIETAGGVMANVIDRNIMLPTRISKSFTTSADNQPAVSIQVYKGERVFTKDNKRLGRFDLTEIPPAPRGVPKIEVHFDIDANGILTVTAEDESSGRLKDITITGDIWRPSKEDVDRMIDDAERHKRDDDARRERITATNQLEHVE